MYEMIPGQNHKNKVCKNLLKTLYNIKSGNTTKHSKTGTMHPMK